MPLRRSERIANLAKKQDNSNVTENKLPYNVANHYSEAREKAIKMLLTSKEENSVARIFSGMGTNYFFKKINDKIEHICMYQGDWGQYGNMDKFNKYKNFVRGNKII